ncbi:MAG: UDP-N-acetylglucosamine 2-epimerase (non-hydrolyzing) [Planctomycetaceae bacterium]|nr:UDP-N-acetylglucosamine 2-epimerase (non-hydrolyzing) [Planctomycetaceae bacterium]
MTTLRIAVVAGARPNFMKVAPILRAMDSHGGFSAMLVHTGQHYDAALSDVFFEELGIRQPDVRLVIRGKSHGEQTGEILQETEKVFARGYLDGQPLDGVIVVGDVNSTLAAALAATKLQIPVAHVEAGLRSRDRSMPEEINRLATDAICELLLASEPAAVQNLENEGHPQDRVFLVGNVMIDTLQTFLPRARSLRATERFNLTPGNYATVTLHRPSNVDNPETLGRLIDVLVEISERLPIVFPVHPRTRSRLESGELLRPLEQATGIRLTEPLGYLEMLCLNSQAKVIITDSGGLQEESTALGIPCLTMRENTERPVTVTEGTSTLIGNDAARLKHELENVLTGMYRTGSCPKLWDGHAAERIVAVLHENLPDRRVGKSQAVVNRS